MKNKIFFLFTFYFLVEIVFLYSCSYNKVYPITKFSTNILPIIRNSCSINSNCHLGATNNNAKIDFTDSNAYQTIINKGLVNITNPNQSLFYSVVNNGIMPKSPYPKLSNNNISSILNWIEAGAINN